MKTTIIIPTYPEDPHQKTAVDALESIRIKNYLLIDPKEKHTFAENNNKGARMAETEYLLFLNSDTIPEPGFVEEMEKVLDSNPQFGVVGAKLYFVEDIAHRIKFNNKNHVFSGEKGKVQHAGIAFNRQLMPEEVGKGALIDSPYVNEKRAMGAVTGACMMVRKEDFLKIGGFDENFRNGWEDTDLCLRMLKELKKLTIYQPKAVVGHYHGGAIAHGRFDSEDANQQYFVKKWHDSGDIYKMFYNLPDEITKLDVGCGSKKKEGYFGLDKYESEQVDFVFDLEEISPTNKRLPFGNSTIEEIYCAHTLEHAINTIEIMNEFHRVLKTDGWLNLIVPHAFSWAGWASPFHKRFFVPETFLQYFASDQHAEKLKVENEMVLIKPWHIESLDYTKVPEGINPLDVEREIVVKMRPLK